MERTTFKVFSGGVEIDKVRVYATVGHIIYTERVDEYGDPIGFKPYYDLHTPGISIRPWTPKSKDAKRENPRFEPLVAIPQGVLGVIRCPDPEYPGVWIALKTNDGSIREYVKVEEICNTHVLQALVYSEPDYDGDPTIVEVKNIN